MFGILPSRKSLRSGGSLAFDLGLLLLVSATLLFAGCADFHEGSVHYFQQGESSADLSWADIFTETQLIDLNFPDLETEILAIGVLQIDSLGRLLLPDGPNHRVLVIDPEQGEIVQSIGSKGQGPGEFSIMGPMALDGAGNLLIYDIDGRNVSVFTGPDYEFERTFFLSTYVSTLIPDVTEGGTFIYSPYDQNLLKKFDEKGRLVASGFKPADNRLRLFHARFQNGGAVADQRRNSLFAIHPDRFAVLEFDQDLNLVRTLKGKERSTWRPEAPKFPSDLSPYEFSPRHRKWWDSFLHVGRIFMIDSETLAITLFESDGYSNAKNYLSMYRTDGTILAEGIEIPNNGHVVAARDGRIYVTTPAFLTEAGAVVPADLREFTLISNQSPNPQQLAAAAPNEQVLPST